MQNVVCQSDDHMISEVSSRITLADRWDHLQARLGIRRNRHRVEPGLYTLGKPSSESPVFASANYTLSFDALRSALAGVDCYILVLDTKGINVWCAAGKGTFGTDELVQRIEGTGLAEIVNHRKVIVPQLGAPGIAAHEVKQRSGFRVEYGPVRARDLPAYLETGKADNEMRRVTFHLADRLVLVPVEIVHMLLPMLVIAGVFYLVGGWLGALGTAVAIMAGVVLFPILLPWLPTANFSTKGFILGGLVAVPFILARLINAPDMETWQRTVWGLTHLLLIPSMTAFLTLNFTGSTSFTSRSGVRREIFTYFPAMAWMFGGGLVLSITMTILGLFGI
ncbi:MAG: carbon monoxide dehydrogenase [Fidelibacterota bacterium]|nr:MAG: carbon monoxide dehydrogenase [Candidatus Neomarinimicrobiota bacterium]